MSERERLMELIGNIPIGGVPFKARFSKSVIEKFADNLLENGVIVPPVKIGDTVYQNDSAGRIYEITVTKVIYDTNGIAFDESAIGLNIFLTKEEAKKALKGGTE